MQIALGKKGDYSVRAMLALARAYGDGRRKARHIARVMDIPVRYLPQVMAPLVKVGLVRATAGPDGGYELTREPGNITLLEVVEAAEGSISGDRCLLEGGPCDWAHVCPVHDAWARAHATLAGELQRTTFAELARNDLLIEEGKFPVPRQPAHPRPVERRGQRGPVGPG